MESVPNNVVNFEAGERKMEPEDVRLATGDPLYYVLLKETKDGVVSPAASQEAHESLRALFAADPEKVISCWGKKPEEAKEILNSIEIAKLEEAA